MSETASLGISQPGEDLSIGDAQGRSAQVAQGSASRVSAGTPSIIPLTKPELQLVEGGCQRNCVASYGQRIAAGRAYIYSVTEPERATLCLVPAGKHWRISELLAAANRPVSEATRKAVKNWLRCAQLSQRKSIAHPEPVR